ncbi:MAG: hypothetical protein ACC700_14070 [Anaerolineales bacterium]
MATSDRTAEEAEESLRGDIAAVMDEEPAKEEAPAQSTPEKSEGFVVFKAKASEAITYIRECENISEVYDLIQAEEKGKARKPVIQEGMSRVIELNLLKEKTQEQAQADLEAPDLAEVDAADADADDAAKEVETAAVVIPPVAQKIDEYPIESGIWEGEMGRYTEVKHIARTMHPMGGLDERTMSPPRLNEYLEERFADGFELIKVLPQGFGPDGVSILYVLGKVRPELESKHKNIWHIQRTLTERPALSGGITGFQADKYLNSFLSEGWQLFAADSLKEGEAEIPMLWVLVR